MGGAAAVRTRASLVNRPADAGVLARCDEAARVGEHDGVDAIAQRQLGEDAAHVRLDRRLRDEDGGADLRGDRRDRGVLARGTATLRARKIGRDDGFAVTPDLVPR
jgi:hypothetical protein